jgi:hypothetical protein
MFNIVFTADECDDIEPSKKSDCTDYKLTDPEKALGVDACCYETYKYENKEYKVCDYNIKKTVTKDYVKAIGEENGYEDYSIECHSNWLSLCLSFSLFALLF